MRNVEQHKQQKHAPLLQTHFRFQMQISEWIVAVTGTEM
jgi:hypothetical protein